MMNRKTAELGKIALVSNLVANGKANPGRLKMAALVLAVVALALGTSAQAHAQGLLSPLLECVEYPTGAASLGTSTYIAHFGYFGRDASTFNLATSSSNNFVSPSTSLLRRQSTENFYPGWHSNAFRVQYPTSTRVTWFLGSGYSIAVPIPLQNPQSSSSYPLASPVCPAALLPAPLSFTAAGTYSHQYLGQVDSGPENDTTILVTAVASTPNVTVSNVTYVAADPAIPPPANPGAPESLTNIWNPNSIYGDIVVGPSATGSTGLVIQLAANGTILTTATSSITLPATSSTPIPPVTTGSCPVDVTSYVSETLGVAKQTLGSPTWTQTVTIRNTSNMTIAGPILVALTNLSPNAGLFAAGGYGTCNGIAGAPYAYVTGTLAPGASAAALLTFTNSQVPSPTITFTPVVLSGGSHL